MAPLPWSEIVRATVLATVLLIVVVIVDVQLQGGHALGLVQPGASGPSVQVIAEDFPELELPDGIGHDGQQFYAIARAFPHFDDATEHLDRPRYRLQRPLFPALAWALHPGDGGMGLVLAMFGVGVLAVAGLGLVAGALSATVGGPPGMAAVAVLLPGTYYSLRLTVADTLALALGLAAVTLVERRRTVPALAAAVGAVLAKEAVLVALVGHALHRRTRASFVAAGGAAVVVGGWWLALRALVEADNRQVIEFTWPFDGVVTGFRYLWTSGDELVGAAAVVAAAALAVAALWRGWAHPLAGALAATAAFSTCLSVSALALNANGTRILGPVMLLALIILGSPRETGARLSGNGDDDASSDHEHREQEAPGQ